MLDFIKSDSFRRIVALLVAVAVPFLNSKLGMQLDDAQVVSIIVAIAVYIAQGGWKAAAVANADAHVEAAKLMAGAGVPDPAATPNLRGPSPAP